MRFKSGFSKCNIYRPYLPQQEHVLSLTWNSPQQPVTQTSWLPNTDTFNQLHAMRHAGNQPATGLLRGKGMLDLRWAGSASAFSLNHILGVYPAFTPLPKGRRRGKWGSIEGTAPFRSDQGEGGLVCFNIQEHVLWRRWFFSSWAAALQ